MADGRVAKLTISPGIGCTVYHNDSGKALSATFFSNTISTDANSKMTVVVASASTVLTKQEVLWQPSYCLRCYSGFFTCKPECQAYPDPTKMAAAYTCGIFQSNIGTGQSGTPGMNKCLYTCFCAVSAPRTGYNWSGCISWCMGCVCPRDWCCYSARFTALNCCATGGARFTRPSMAMVAAGTTYSGFVHPTPNTMDVMVYNCIGHMAGGSESWHYNPLYCSCAYSTGNGCDDNGRKSGWMCACCVPVLWGGTEVINPAIGFTFPPLYDGTKSGFTTTTGGCWRCDCYTGPMWASQITGVFPGFIASQVEKSGIMICGNPACCCKCCRGDCCCGADAPSQAGIKGRTGTCTDGIVVNEYFWTRCNTPNVQDAMRRLVSPYDDVGIGGTGIPFCYCTGQAPGWSQQKGGWPCNLQSARNYIGDCYGCLCDCSCQCSTVCGRYQETFRASAWMVDWYGLTAICNWCHCELCYGKLTKHVGSEACNETCCECWCCTLCSCTGGSSQSGWCCELYQSNQKVPMAFTFASTWNWVGAYPRLCITPCCCACGTWCMSNGGVDGHTYYCMGTCGCNGFNNSAPYGGRLYPLWHGHGPRLPSGGCCCNNGIFGYCCWNCSSAYSGCNCGPCQEGTCGTYQPKSACRCGTVQCGVGGIGGSPSEDSNAQPVMSPYGVNFAFSNGIVTHYHRKYSYKRKGSSNMDSGCHGYSFVLPIFSAFGGWCQAQSQSTCKGIRPIFIPMPRAGTYATCDADINGGQANAPIKHLSSTCGNMQVHCITKDSGGNLVCTAVEGAIKQWCCTQMGGFYAPEFPMKYFAYNPYDDCHYFMLRTDELTYHDACGWDCTPMGCIRKYHESGTAQQKGAFLPDMKTCLLTNNWLCGIFSINCQALSEFQRNNRCHCLCCGICGCNGCCDQCRYWMCYDGGTKFPEYKDYPCWGYVFCTGNTVTCGSCTCCICEILNYETFPCQMRDCTFTGVTPCFGIRYKVEDDCFHTDNGGATWSQETDLYQRGVAGLGTVFFRKVGNFPSVMTDYKYTQPMMCVGCLFRSDNKLWSLPVYNHCEYRWDTFLTCDLKQWNKQEFVKCNIPADQMTTVCDCCVLNLTENYLCRCTDCFMSGFQREGLVELCLSFNQYERTGIVLSEGDRIYVKNNDDNTTGKCINFQVWGYEG